MNILRKWTPPILAILLAAAAAFLPPSLSRLRDSLVLSGVHAEEESALPAPAELSVAEKLELICRSTQDPSGVIQSNQNYDASQNEAILQAVREDLQQLRKTGLFPVRMQEDEEAYPGMTRITYTDSADLSRSASFWEIRFYAEGSLLKVLADSDTGKIYEYSYLPDLNSSFAVDLESEPDFSQHNALVLNTAEDMDEALRQFAGGLGLSLDRVETEKAPLYAYAHVEDSPVSFILQMDLGAAFTVSLSLAF